MPVLWFEQHVVADKTVSNIVKLILAAPTLGQILGFIFAVTGLALFVAAIVCKRDAFVVQLTDKSKTDSQKTTNLPETLPLMRN